MQSLSQQVGPPRLVVDITDQRVLNRHPSPGHIGVVPGRIERFADPPPVVDRN
ncbi:Uncharacterised protein [Mycobacterium tuberculosis]|nr:Uncharacterised protein [Mycobacterium tuberculosis]